MAAKTKKAGRKNWGFNTKYIDTAVRPQDDFYNYAVGNWLKTHTIPENESRWGSFLILRHKTDTQLRELLTEVSKKKSVTKGSPEQMIRDLYCAATDMKLRARLGTAPIEPLRERIRHMAMQEDLYEVIKELHRIGTGGLWGFGVDQDAKKSDKYILHIYQDGLGMPEREYYLKDAKEQKRVRAAYKEHIRKLLVLAGYKENEAKRAVETVMEIETALARASMKKEDLRIPEKTYHKFPLSGLGKIAPTIDWKNYFAYMGATPKEIIVMQPEFLKTAMRLLKSLPIDDWKIYLEWHLINDSAGSLSSAFEKQSFAFYGTVLSGSKKMKPRWRIALGAVNGCAGEQLGKLYVNRYFGSDAKHKVDIIVKDLVAAYERRINGLDWMSPVTKKKALVKLNAMQRKLGYPDKWKSYRGLVIKADDHFGNLLRSHEYELRRELNKLGKPIDRSEWFMYPQTVNAYYAPTMNDIVFPAGILQHPFFDANADDAVNYGAMGMVIGHELTHGFDDQGAKFDAKGNLKNWWTKKDKERFEAKGKLVKRQYDRYIVEGLPVNGTLTLGENIADLGGLVISFDAYQRRLARTGRKNIDGFTPDQRFFLAYAQSEHELSRPESMKMRILTDPHSPSVCRVNGPLSNMTEFYEALNVKKGDKLYRSPVSRAKIW